MCTVNATRSYDCVWHSRTPELLLPLQLHTQSSQQMHQPLACTGQKQPHGTMVKKHNQTASKEQDNAHQQVRRLQDHKFVWFRFTSQKSFKATGHVSRRNDRFSVLRFTSKLRFKAVGCVSRQQAPSSCVRPRAKTHEVYSCQDMFNPIAWAQQDCAGGIVSKTP